MNTEVSTMVDADPGIAQCDGGVNAPHLPRDHATWVIGLN